MIVTTDAVILKGMKFKETSRILTLYTREFGKLSAVAKGARDRKTRFGAALEPMSYVRAVLYKKETSELHLLSQCDVLRPMRRLTDDMERMAPAMAMVELVSAVCHAEEGNAPLFNLLLEGLGAINDATKNPGNALYGFEVHLLDLMGFRPNFHQCFSCGAPIGGMGTGPSGTLMHMVAGGAVCGDCSARGAAMRTLSAGALKGLQYLQEKTTLEAATALTLTPHIKAEIAGILRYLLQSHIEGLRDLKSEQVFSALL